MIPLSKTHTMCSYAGSLNTIATKIQDGVVVGTDSAGKELLFKHPGLQTAFMFAGEALCLIPFFIGQWIRSDTATVSTPRNQQQLSSADGSGNSNTAGKTTAAMFRSTALAFTLPALCDAGATTLLNLGLYYTYASVFQMLRGTLVVFAGILTIVLLKRRLRSHNWFGIVLITAGAALVGASSIVYEKQDAAAGGAAKRVAPNPLLGNLLVIIAQLLNAVQFIVEEKFLHQLRPPVLLAVGTEGVVGVMLCTVALPLLSHVPGPGGSPIDDASTAFSAIAASSTLQWTTLLTVLSIAAFNFCGISVTKRLSGTSRAAIDACRTAVVWLFCLQAGWERFHMLQVVGFAILITGTSVYNDILRSFMSPLPSSARDHFRYQEGSGAGGTDGGGEGRHHPRRRRTRHPTITQSAEEAEERLLPSDSESDSDKESDSGGLGGKVPSPRIRPGRERKRGSLEALREVTVEYEDLVENPSSSSSSLLPGGGGGGDAVAGMVSRGDFQQEQQQQQQQQRGSNSSRHALAVPTYRVSSSSGGRVRQQPQQQPITMARSVSFLPSVLSPHSLASMPSDSLFLSSVQSGVDSLYATGGSSASESSDQEEEEGNGVGDGGSSDSADVK
jgi:drug/metabolite transporter (DMT)-like permease